MIRTDNGRVHVERWWHVHCYRLSRLFSHYLLCTGTVCSVMNVPFFFVPLFKEAPIFGRWIMYIATVNCPATWAATVCLRGLTNVCCTSVCPISGIRCVQTMVFLCPNSGIWCVQTVVFLWVQTMVFLCPNMGISVCPNNGIWCVQTMVFGVSKQWYLGRPNKGISVSKQWYLVCPNNDILYDIWFVQTMVFGVFKQWGLCMSKQWYLMCSNNGICVCPN